MKQIISAARPKDKREAPGEKNNGQNAVLVNTINQLFSFPLAYLKPKGFNGSIFF